MPTGLNKTDLLERVSFCDFETITINTAYYKEHQDTRITLYVWMNAYQKTPKIGTELNELIEYWGSLKNDWVVYFHNLKFDGRFIWAELLKQGWTLFNGSYKQRAKAKSNIDGGQWIDRTKNCFKINGDGANIYSMDLYYSNGRYICLKCSYKLIPISLEAMGKTIGVDKHNELTKMAGFYDVEPQKHYMDYPRSYWVYAIRDVEILRDFFKKIFIPFLINIYSKLDIHKPIEYIPLTIGGLSQKIQMDYIEHHYKADTDRALFINGDNELLARNFYRGGLTLYNDNWLNVEFKNGVYIDINSAYPYAMTKHLPYGEITTEKPDSPYIEWVHIYVNKAIIKNPKGLKPLNNWIEKNKHPLGGNIFVNGCIDILYDFNAYYMLEEFELLKEFYDFDYRVIKTYYTLAQPFLKNYTHGLYDFKEKATDAGFKQMVKLLLNNGYGKYGQDKVYNYLYVCKDEADYKQRMENKEGYNIMYVKAVNDEYTELYEAQDVSTENHLYLSGLKLINYKRTNRNALHNPNVWTAAAITAYNRIFLMRAFLECGDKEGNVVYCDTDSLILLDATPVYNPNNKIVKLHPSKLGYWGIELENVRGRVLNKKIYDVIGEKNGKTTTLQKAKGMNKDKVSEFMELSKLAGDYIELKDGKKFMKKAKSGWVLVTKDVKISNNPLKHQIKIFTERSL